MTKIVSVENLCPTYRVNSKIIKILKKKVKKKSSEIDEVSSRQIALFNKARNKATLKPKGRSRISKSLDRSNPEIFQKNLKQN